MTGGAGGNVPRLAAGDDVAAVTGLLKVGLGVGLPTSPPVIYYKR